MYNSFRILLTSPEVIVTKSATWKHHRDQRRCISESNDTIELRELDELLKDSPWKRGWVDYHDGAQAGIIYLIRPDVDECAVIEWPAYAGWGDKGTPIPRRAINETHQLLRVPPPPRLRTVKELEGCIGREERFLKILCADPESRNDRVQSLIDECEKLIENYRLLLEERKSVL
jgi:hypothetical protein